MEAIRTGRETMFAPEDDHWPAFTERAILAGVRSVWSLPLKVRDRTTGALNLYAMGGEAWPATSQRLAHDLASQAAVVLANAAALMGAELTNEHLRVALETRDMIGQAKGILMARQGVSGDQAFDVLRRASQRTNRKLRDVATDVINQVTHPEQQPERGRVSLRASRSCRTMLGLSASPCGSTTSPWVAAFLPTS